MPVICLHPFSFVLSSIFQFPIVRQESDQDHRVERKMHVVSFLSRNEATSRKRRVLGRSETTSQTRTASKAHTTSIQQENNKPTQPQRQNILACPVAPARCPEGARVALQESPKRPQALPRNPPKAKNMLGTKCTKKHDVKTCVNKQSMKY